MLGESAYAQDKFQANSGKNDGFVHERKSAQVKHIFKITDDVKLTTNAYYVDAERSSFRQTHQPTSTDVGLERHSDCGVTTSPRGSFTTADAAQCGGRHRPRSYNFFGFEPRLDIKHSLFGLESDAVIGMRYHEEDISRKQYRGNTATAQSLSFLKATSQPREDIDIKVNAMSYYLQNTFYAGNWSVTPGVRYEDMTIKTNIHRADGNSQNNPESDLKNSQSKLLPGFGVAWNGIANTTLFAGVHKGFAPPRPDRDFDVNGADVATVSKTKPETTTNWEVGARSNYYKGINVNSTLFLTNFDDVVVQDPTGTRFSNGGEAKQSGIELAGRVDFGSIYDTPHNIYVTANYTGLFTAKFTKDVARERIEDGNRMPYAPRDIASVNLGYQHPVGFDARLGLDYVGQQHSTNANDRTLSVNGTTGIIPSYTLLNASASFKPVGSRLTYFVSGHNLADKEFLQSRVDGMSVGRGRQVFGGVTIAF
jgi:Fe(3+) dicitrate transport protein